MNDAQSIITEKEDVEKGQGCGNAKEKEECPSKVSFRRRIEVAPEAKKKHD